MAVDEVFKLTMHSTFQDNKNMWCAFYKETNAPSTQSTPVALSAAFEAQVDTEILPIKPTGWHMDCITVEGVEFFQPYMPFVAPTDYTGTLAGGELPGQCSAIVETLPDDVTAKVRQRGRDFWTGLVEGGDQVDGVMQQAAANRILNFYIVQILPDLTGNGGIWEYGNYSYRQRKENLDPQFVSNGGSVPDPPTFGDPPFTQVTFVRMNALVRTQRRREPIDPCAIPLVDATV